MIRVRGVRMLTPEGEVRCHVDAYNSTDGELLHTPMQLSDKLRPLLVPLVPSLDEYMAWQSFARMAIHWRFGRHPAVQCQVDNILSIADEIRSGRYVRNLFCALYLHTDFMNWTKLGINIGAGIGGLADSDPLDAWVLEFASRVLLVDGDERRLRAAIEKLSAAGHGDAVLVPVADVATPANIDLGPLGEFICGQMGSRVDVIKVDIDSFDCPVLQSLLHHVEASIIVMESQPLVPPPIKFARLYHPGDPLEDGLVGCSLSYQLRMLHPTYRLLVYTEHDVIFAHNNLTLLLEALPPSSVFGWTSFPFRLPADEFDCFRRSRLLGGLRHAVPAADSSRVQPAHDDVPAAFIRDWALTSHPTETLSRLWGNLSGLMGRPGGQSTSRAIYSLDV